MGSPSGSRARHLGIVVLIAGIGPWGGQVGCRGSDGSGFDALGDPLWSLVPSLATPRHQHVAVLLQNGKVLAIGGSSGTAALGSTEMYDPATGTWSPGASLAAARQLFTATLLQNGKVLVVGGQGAGNVVLGSAELYDPALGTWSAAGALVTPRMEHTATLLADGRVLVSGGWNPTILASAEIYDPVLNKWSATGSLVKARTQHTATLLANGQVLIAGGVSTAAEISSELYNPAAGTWTTTGSMTVARYFHSATLLPSGQVLIVGGATGTPALKSAELFNPSTGTWSATAVAPPTGRKSHSATLLPNGQVLVAFGQDTTGAYPTTADLYDPGLGSWTTTTGKLTTGRKYHATTLLPSGQVLASGGFNGAAINGAELYDPSNGVSSSTGLLISARFLHTATLLPSGQVLVTGGSSNGSAPLATAELYSPGIGTWAATTGSLVSARFLHTSTLLSNGQVLVAGGTSNGTASVASSELYDPGLGTWAATPGALTSPRHSHTATLLPGGQVLAAGGTSDGATPLASAEIFDPGAGSWSPTINSLTNARFEHTATLLPDGKVLAAGGTSNGSAPLASAEIYDPASRTWTPTTGPLGTACFQHTATLLPSGKVLVAGGTSNGSSPLASAELYDPTSGSWLPTGALANARMLHTATLLPNGKVLVAGGVGTAGPIGSSELYDPVSGTWSLSAPLAGNRAKHTATLLFDGRVLLAGGESPAAVQSAELFDEGRGAPPARVPTLSGPIPSAVPGATVSVTGTLFSGPPEGSSGSTMSSPANFPVFVLERQDSETIAYVGVSAWGATTATLVLPASLQPGPQLLRVVVNGIPGNAAPVVVAAPAPPPPAKLVFAVQPSNAVSGSAIAPAVAVALQDAAGAIVSSSGSITLAIASSPGPATLSGTLTVNAVNGVATFSGLSIDKAGTGYTLIATTTGSAPATSAPFNISAGPAVSLSAAGFPSPVTVGTPASITVTAFDASGNVALGYAGTVALASSDANAALPAPYAFQPADAGKKAFQVTLKTAGSASITATDSSATPLSAAQQGIQVLSGAVAELLVSGIPSPLRPGVLADLTVEARDAFGNRARDYVGTVYFSSSDSLAVLPSPTAFALADGGLKTFLGAVRFGTPGIQSVTATDVANALLKGSQTGIVVGSQQPVRIVPDANLRAAVGVGYVYNDLGAVTATGVRPMSFDRCAGPVGFRVDPISGAVRWTPDTPGLVDFCVLARNASGEDRYSFTVEVASRQASPISAAFTATPASGPAALNVRFDASGTQVDASALPPYFRWQFGDGSAPGGGKQPAHTYVLPGGYRPRLSAFDVFGASASADGAIEVLGPSGQRPPRARIVASQTRGRDSLSLDFSCDCQQGSSPIAAYAWDLGNGATSSSSSSSAVYSPGRYHVSLTVVDAAGLSASDKIELVVTQGDREPPECTAAVDPPAGEAPLRVTWTGLAASSSGSIASEVWRFGSSDSVAQAVVARSYGPGRYQGELTVQDEAGLKCTDSATATVLAGGVIPPRIVGALAPKSHCHLPYRPSGEGLAIEGSLPVEWSLADGAPAGLSIDAQSGAIAWAPEAEQTGSQHVSIVASNAAGRDERSFEVEVVCPGAVAVDIGCGCGSSGQAPLAATLTLLAALGWQRPRYRKSKR